MTKYIFVTGGVVSSIGKGIVAASLGRLLKNRGLKVTIQKFDPYINIDPGTMSPYQHGEVFVTDDGAETDLDLLISTSINIQMLQLVKFIAKSFVKSVKVSIWAQLFKLFHILRML